MPGTWILMGLPLHPNVFVFVFVFVHCKESSPRPQPPCYAAPPSSPSLVLPSHQWSKHQNYHGNDSYLWTNGSSKNSENFEYCCECWSQKLPWQSSSILPTRLGFVSRTPISSNFVSEFDLVCDILVLEVFPLIWIAACTFMVSLFCPTSQTSHSSNLKFTTGWQGYFLLMLTI